MCVNLTFFLLSAAITCFCEKKNCKTKKNIFILTNIVQNIFARRDGNLFINRRKKTY